MDVQFTAYLFIAPFVAMAAVFTALLMLRNIGSPRAQALMVFLLLISGWLISNTLELGSPSPASTIFWARVVYIFIHTSMVSWLVFAARYADVKGIQPYMLAILAVVPAITIILVFTPSLQHWIWESYSFRQGQYYLYMHVERYGSWFWVQSTYLYVLILFGAYLILHKYLQSFHIFRQSSIAVLAGVLLPLLTNFVYILKLIPNFQKDYTAVSYAVAGIIFSWGIFRNRSMAVSPVALNTVIDMISDGMIVVDNRAQVIEANPAALLILRKSRNEVFGLPIHEVLTDWPSILEKSKANPSGCIEIELGEHPVRYFECKLSAVYTRRGQVSGLVILLHEVTERVELLKTVQELAITDPLTQVANRRYFFEHADKELQRAQRYHRSLALIMFDIDHFKTTNDRYGHLVGDQVLVELALLCSQQIRGIDLLARLGGEEFVILMPETSLSHALDVAERLRKEVEQHVFQVHNSSFSISISLGVAAILHQDGLNITQYLERADQAMYAAKRAGRNRVRAWGVGEM